MGCKKISIITVSYNAVETIEQTILSVIHQTYKNIEYIIIDGGSVDGTIDVIKKYQNNIAYWVSEPDDGIYNAMNKGILKATGEYIHILGADDCFVSPKSLENISSYFNSTIELVSSKVYLVDEVRKMQLLDNGNLSLQQILHGEKLQHQGIFVSSKIMKDNLFNTEYPIAADFDFILRCVLKGVRITYVPEAVAFFSTGGISSVKVLNNLSEILAILNKYPESKIYVGEFYKKNIVPFLKKMKYLEKQRRRLLRERSLSRRKKLLLQQGWKEHSCSNEKCRWCN